jgi:hypothetical protein
MRDSAKRVLSVVAILAIALNAMLWGIAPMSAAPSADPFSVICHSGSASLSDQTPADPASVPSHGCDHCNLCSAASTPPSALNTVLAGILTPVKLLRVVPQATAAPFDGVAYNPNKTRGPPQLA